MTDDTQKPAIVEMGAGQDDSTRGVNLDVRGTPGPGHLGQDTVDVDGHPNDRPGVRNRMPESARDHPEIRRMDTGEDLPVLLSSSMKADPCEGVQGSYSEIVEGECARCGYDRLKVAVHTLAGEHEETCNACGAKQRPRSEKGYRMPRTDKERARRERESGQKLTSLTTRDVYDMEPDTGMGPYVSLVTDRAQTRLRKDDVEQLFWTLADNDDVDLAETLDKNLRPRDRVAVGMALLPERGIKALAGDCPDDDELEDGDGE